MKKVKNKNIIKQDRLNRRRISMFFPKYEFFTKLQRMQRKFISSVVVQNNRTFEIPSLKPQNACEQYAIFNLHQ